MFRRRRRQKDFFLCAHGKFSAFLLLRKHSRQASAVETCSVAAVCDTESQRQHFGVRVVSAPFLGCLLMTIAIIIKLLNFIIG